jgi:hypothetical protein
MFEIREWNKSQRIVIFNKIPSLKMAWSMLDDLKKNEPKKVFSIFRSKEGRGKNDYYA